GSYEDDIDDSFATESVSPEIALFYAAKAGARKKYIEWDLIKKYVNYKKSSGCDVETVLGLIELCSDVMVEEKLFAERPGMEEIRNEAYTQILERFIRIHLNSPMEKVRYALVLDKMGKSAAFDSLTLRLLKEIKECAQVKDTREIILHTERLYNKYFSDLAAESIMEEEIIKKVEEFERQEVDSSFADFLFEELFKDNKIDAQVEQSIEQISGAFLIESLGELKSDTPSTTPQVVYVDEETAEKIYNKIEYYYGKSYLSPEEVNRLQQKVCTGIHLGCRVHFTDGVLRTKSENMFQVKLVSRHKENNLSYYRQKPRVYKRNILRLKQTILQTMVAENQKTIIPADHGVIVANRLWRVGRSHNRKLFNKIMENEKGRYVVDILIDASGSQRANQGKVAVQAYILSMALTLAKIPNRVLGFSSFLDYTILRRYRDYDDSLRENENIFEYFAAGNNRDGLAIRAVCESLKEREEENKILIVISDGKPNDIKISKSSQRFIAGELPYKGITALKDTAREVRRARNEGILVFGVYTGREEELYAEKYIYGKDFFYVKNIERISDIAGMFLRRVIENY
ncbi:MAG: nitric oxide reductase activation-like protein, partial [Firmicutes bacterium]|nr:nitric oxide reductase activation-like protein [Bacillota bacterium]